MAARRAVSRAGGGAPAHQLQVEVYRGLRQLARVHRGAQVHDAGAQLPSGVQLPAGRGLAERLPSPLYEIFPSQWHY